MTSSEDENILRMAAESSLDSESALQFYSEETLPGIRSLEREIFLAARQAGVFNSPEKEAIIQALRRAGK